MGHRANLIIVRNDSYELYYSHWCANTLPSDLFWGERHGIAFIEKQTKVDEQTGWLDDIWAEGGALVDVDKKKLLFYGGEDLQYEIPLRNLYLKLMRSTWRGWVIQWAHEGILDLADYVGYPKDNVLKRSLNRMSEIRLAPPGSRDWVDTVASVRFPGDDLLLFPLSGDIDDYLISGPDLINQMNKAYGYRSLAMEEWMDCFPTGGFHIDIERRTLEFWHAKDIPNISHSITSAWPDWHIVNRYSDYESHVHNTNGQLQFENINPQQLLEQLRGFLLNNRSSNPVEAIALIVHREEAAGKKVEVNPYALINNPYEIAYRDKEQIFNDAVSQLS